MELKDIVNKNIAVYCRTKKQAKKFIKLCKDNGYGLPKGTTKRERSKHRKNQNHGICYNIKKSVHYTSIFNYLLIRYHIIKFKEIN